MPGTVTERWWKPAGHDEAPHQEGRLRLIRLLRFPLRDARFQGSPEVAVIGNRGRDTLKTRHPRIPRGDSKRVSAIGKWTFRLCMSSSRAILFKVNNRYRFRPLYTLVVPHNTGRPGEGGGQARPQPWSS